MNKIIIALMFVLIGSTFSYADWSKTTTTASNEDTFIVSDNSEATGSKTNYIALEDLAAEVLDRADEPIVQADDPTVSSENGIYFATTSQKMFVKDDSFLWGSASGTYTAIASGYELTLGITGDGSVTIGGTTYTSSTVIPSLSGVVPITALYTGISNTVDTTGVTGSYDTYSITMDADKPASFAFSTTSTYLVDEDFSGTTIPTGFVGTGTPDYTASGSVSFDYFDALTTDNFSALGTVYTAGVFSLSALDNTGDTNVVVFLNESGVALSGDVSRFTIRANDVTRAYHGSASEVGPDLFTTATDYYFWIFSSKSTGADDGVIEVRIGTDATYANATVWATETAGTSTDDIRAIRIGQYNSDTTGEITFKRLIVSDSAIGDIN